MTNEANSYILPELDALIVPLDPTWDLPAMRGRGDENAKAALRDTPQIPGVSLTVSVVAQTGLEVRCWAPTSGSPDLLIFAIHGGGYVMGVACLDDLRNAEIAARYNAVVVAPEYSLAPEAPFPTAGQQCYDALAYAIAQHPGLPVVLYGDSAGSGLVETVTCLALDANTHVPDALICLEPAIDPASAAATDHTSMIRYADGPGWSRSKALHSWQAYLAGQDETVIPRLVDRQQVPPVLTVLGQSDPLRDEGLRWALGLADAGVHTELHLMPGGVHGFLSAAGTRTWERVQGYIAEFLESVFGTAATPADSSNG